MTGLTPQMKKLLDFIAEQASYGVAPSYDEMAAHLGYQAKSAVHGLLERLSDRGYVRFEPRKARSVQIVVRQCPHCGGRL